MLKKKTKQKCWRDVACAVVYLHVTDVITDIRETRRKTMHVMAKMIPYISDLPFLQ